MNRLCSIFFVLLLFSTVKVIKGQPVHNFPADYFRSPLNIPLKLSGTFGELRGNHFHSGIDITTNGSEGYKLYSAAEGYICRIKISPGGFGNALYVQHPNGLMTVYAHMQRFNDEIIEYTDSIQYARREFAIDVSPPPGRFRVDKGEILGLSGNSGSSGGPHLHFEIRKGDTPLNPLFFGFEVLDNIPPEISAVYTYNHSQSRYKLSPDRYSVKKVGNTYTPYQDTLYITGNTAGIGIQSIDKLNGRNNRNGVYSILMKVDDHLVYNFVMDSFWFHESRYINAHIDFGEYIRHRKRIQRCFLLPGNNLSVYRDLQNNGIIDLSDGNPRKVEMTIKDADGNFSNLKFYIRKKGNETIPLIKPDKIFDYADFNYYFDDKIILAFPEGCLYDTLDFFCKIEETSGNYSDVFSINDDKTPIQKEFFISLRPNYLPTSLIDKALIVQRNSKGNVKSIGGNYEKGFISSTCRELGDFYISVDTIPPVISPVNISNNKYMSYESGIKIRIDDNLAGVKKYDAYIDGEWVLMEYDAKRRLLTHYFRNELEPGSHEFVIEVSDEKNNSSTYKTIFRK